MKYKIRINDIVPKLNKELIYGKKCYLGISINNPFFLSDHLILLLKWIYKRFPTCKIVIGDHLHRINEYIISGKEGEEAIEVGKKLGKIIKDKLLLEMKNFSSDFFDVEFWEKYYYDINTTEKLNKLKYNFDQNHLFRESIVKSATEFIDRQISRGCHFRVKRNVAIEYSIEYLLEELAVFSVLIDRDYQVQVYPGTQLSILKKFGNNFLKDMDTNLNKGIYIDLKVKKHR